MRFNETIDIVALVQSAEAIMQKDVNTDTTTRTLTSLVTEVKKLQSTVDAANKTSTSNNSTQVRPQQQKGSQEQNKL